MSDQKHKILSVLTRIYTGLCNHKRELRITPMETSRSVTYEVVPHELDFRKLIGTEGVLYQYMLLILRKSADRIWITTNPPSQLKVSLEVERLGYGREDNKVPIDPNYDREKMMELINDACSLVFDSFTAVRQDTASKSIVDIKVNDDADPNLFLALNKIFWAYGKATGRLIELEFSNVNQSVATPIARHTV